MSETLLRSQLPERSARVWQSADFLRSDASVPAFKPSAWLQEKAPAFGVQTAGFQEQDEESPGSVQEPEQPPEVMEALPAPQETLPAPAGQFTEQDIEQARLQAYEQGKQHGMREAFEQASANAQQELQASAARVAALEQGVRDLMQAPEQLHEPLKRLALHLAEQLVLGELSMAPQAIERLVQRCIDELAAQRAVPVLIELHPDDVGPMQDLLKTGSNDGSPADEPKKQPAWLVQANASLMPGSVRASANDAVVSDLIEHRLDALAAQLLQAPTRARQQSAFQSDRLAARRADVSQVLDAQPRMADAPRSNRFSPVIDADAAPVDTPEPPQAEGDHE